MSSSIALFDAARATDDGFRIPATVANAILDGEQPVKAWREYRGLTQEALTDKAGWLCKNPQGYRQCAGLADRHIAGRLSAR